MTKSMRPPLVINVIKHKDGIYTALCPSMEPVHFSSKDRDEAIKMAKDGIDMYLKLDPHCLDNIQSAEGIKI